MFRRICRPVETRGCARADSLNGCVRAWTLSTLVTVIIPVDTITALTAMAIIRGAVEAEATITTTTTIMTTKLSWFNVRDLLLQIFPRSRGH